MIILLTGTFITLFVVSAIYDLESRAIPNFFVLSVAALAIFLRIWASPSYFGSLWASGLLFVVLMVLHERNLLGGGDVKLMAAFSFALTPLDCYRFVLATALFGGLLGIAYLLLRRILPPVRCEPSASRLRRIIAVETWRIRRGLSLPYGVAIAAGGIFVLLHPTTG